MDFDGTSVKVQRLETVAGVEIDLDAFVFAHYDRLIRLAALVSGDAADAEDAVQAGLERAWRGRDSLRKAASLSSWVDRIVVREAIRTAARRRRWWSRRRELSDAADATAPTIDLPDHFVALRLAYQALPPDQRAAVALHLYAGHSVPETASLLGAPLETVRSRLRLARRRLRSDLKEDRP